VRFRDENSLSKKARELIITFTKANNLFCALPGKKDPKLKNSLLEELLNFISQEIKIGLID